MLQRIQQYRIQDLAPCHADHTGSREVRVGRVLNSCAVPDEADCEAYWQSLPHSSACGSLTPVPTEPGQLFPAHLASKGLLALASRTAGTVAFTEPSGSSMLEAAEVVQASMLPLHAQIWWLFVGGLPNASRRQGVSQQVPCNKRMSSDWWPWPWQPWCQVTPFHPRSVVPHRRILSTFSYFNASKRFLSVCSRIALIFISVTKVKIRPALAKFLEDISLFITAVRYLVDF